MNRGQMKFIQIAATETDSAEATDAHGTLYALADDGSVWMLIDPWMNNAKWRKLPDVKGEIK